MSDFQRALVVGASGGIGGAISEALQTGGTEVVPLSRSGDGLDVTDDRPSTFAALSARVGSIGDNGIGGWYAYRSSKAMLNQLLHTAAIELRRTHKQSVCVALHPGTVATDFTAKYAGRHKTVTPQEAASNLLSVLSRLTVEDSGGFYDYAGEPIPW